MTQHEQGQTGGSGSSGGVGSARAEADRLARDAGARAGELQDQVRATADRAEAGGVARDVTRDVTREARAAGGAVRNEAAGLVDTVRQGLAAKAEEGKDQVAERIGAIADQVHSTADELRDRQAWLAELMDRGARELDGLARAIQQRDLASMLGAAEGFARRQPVLFLGATIAAGFALTRVARASMEAQVRQEQGRYAYGQGGAGTEYGTGTSAGYGTAGRSYDTAAGRQSGTSGAASGGGITGGASSVTGTAGAGRTAGGQASTGASGLDEGRYQKGATEYERHMQGAAGAGAGSGSGGKNEGKSGGGGTTPPSKGGPAGGSAY